MSNFTDKLEKMSKYSAKSTSSRNLLTSSRSGSLMKRYVEKIHPTAKVTAGDYNELVEKFNDIVNILEEKGILQ